MFDQTITTSWDDRSRRSLTTLTSFSLQVLAAGVLVILPLLRPTGMPSFRQLSTPVSLGVPRGDVRISGHRGAGNNAMNVATEDILRPPSQIPHGLQTDVDDGPPQTAGSGPYVPGAPKGDALGVLNLFGGTQAALPVAAPAAVSRPIQISHMSPGDLIHKVQPAYPPLARSARIQGVVVLQAVISKQGFIENLRVVTGHPMLVPAAIDAVRQWHYRPYILNNEAVEVETQITVNFSLTAN